MDDYVPVATVEDFNAGKFTKRSLEITVATIPLPHYVAVERNGAATILDQSEVEIAKQKCTKVAVFRKPDGKFFAVNAVCPHAGYGLSEGVVMDIEDSMLGKLPVNDDVEGPRRDYGGKLLKYGGDDMWAGDFS
ncbi:hypothetical protein HDU93_000861 [Gonapodya sp. JEL0774]|nr:hypothetical protein HDU93_000861 [Gonapodya sp. JEL0774]